MSHDKRENISLHISLCSFLGGEAHSVPAKVFSQLRIIELKKPSSNYINKQRTKKKCLKGSLLKLKELNINQKSTGSLHGSKKDSGTLMLGVLKCWNGASVSQAYPQIYIFPLMGRYLKDKDIPFTGRYFTWMDYNFFPFIVLKGEPLLDFK